MSTPEKESTINPTVFFTSAMLAFFFGGMGIFYREKFQSLTSFVHEFITVQLGWLLILIVALLVIFCIWIGFSRFGKIRLGPDDSQPDYSLLSWISMLFSAGMGIGLLYYGVAEPMFHFAAPQGADPKSIEAAHFAMQTTFFHWGIHAWAIYATIGLALAYFHYRKGYSLSLRSALKPLLGKYSEGIWGDLIDIFAILGTLFGVATSLGLGAMQVNAGLSHLLGVENSVRVQVFLIAGITLIATGSVVSGLDRGIKFLSEMNMVLATFLFVLIFLTGPTVAILDIMTQSAGQYCQNIISKMFYLSAFGDKGWVTGWTIFYWAWWLSWAPFVGVFLARISRGRTISEFVFYVLLVPTMICILWFSVFGGSAIHFEMQGIAKIGAAVQADFSTALFHFLQEFPMAPFLSGLAIIIVVTFFVTSSDSGSLVIDMLAAGGHPNPPVAQRIFWAFLEGGIAATLLWAGGKVSLKTLQTGAIATGLPLGVLLILMAWSLVKALKEEEESEEIRESKVAEESRET